MLHYYSCFCKCYVVKYVLCSGVVCVRYVLIQFVMLVDCNYAAVLEQYLNSILYRFRLIMFFLVHEHYISTHLYSNIRSV